MLQYICYDIIYTPCIETCKDIYAARINTCNNTHTSRINMCSDIYTPRIDTCNYIYIIKHHVLICAMIYIYTHHVLIHAITYMCQVLTYVQWYVTFTNICTMIYVQCNDIYNDTSTKDWYYVKWYT